MSSHFILGFYGISGVPDGASSGTPDCLTIQPSPVTSAKALPAYGTAGKFSSPHGTLEPYSAAAHPSTTSKPVPRGLPSAAAHGYHVTPEAVVSDKTRPQKQTNLSRRLSLDPYVRLKVSKLEMVQYSGYLFLHMFFFSKIIIILNCIKLMVILILFGHYFYNCMTVIIA